MDVESLYATAYGNALNIQRASNPWAWLFSHRYRDEGHRIASAHARTVTGMKCLPAEPNRVLTR